MSNIIGQTIGRYQILKQVGEGGMAVVFQAYDSHLECNVAIKVIRTEKLTPDSLAKNLKRFEREAKALAKLTHPNIVPITDYGEFKGRPYLVMPFIPSGTLKKFLGNPIPWRDAARFLIPIARALQFAHQQRIIHRDVKPSNILITPSGEPLLTDFGIAKILLDTEETSELTGSGVGIGTPEYMSPEQFQGKQVDERADIYSLGVVFYEMITGRRPYIADTPVGILLKQVTEPLPPPSTFVRNIPEYVEKTLIKALTKDPENRFKNMGGFIQALKYILESPQQPESNVLRQTTLDATYDTFDVNGGQDNATSNTNQNTGGLRSQQKKTHPASTPGWFLWAVGILGLLVMGSIAIAIIALTLPPEQPPTLAPTSFVVVIDPSPVPVDTRPPPPIDFPTLTPTDFPALVPIDFPTLTPTNTQLVPTSILSTNTPACNPKYPSRLRSNQDAKVCTLRERLVIRTFSSMSASEIFRIYTGAVIGVVEGPVCADNFWWWKVNIYQGTEYGYDADKAPTWDPMGVTDKDIIGWAREGWDTTDAYYICQ